MAKKDTYLALLRRGIDENTAHILSDSGVKVGDLKKLDVETLINNYGLKKEVAKSVLDAVRSGPRESSKQRFLADVLSDRGKKKVDKIEEQRFKREQKDLHAELLEKKEQLRIARVEAFRNKKLVMIRLGKTIELIVKLENTFDDESKDEQRSKLRDQLETRGLEAARDHEMLELVGTPQDIVDFRRKIAPNLCLHACPSCGEEIDPRSSNVVEDMTDLYLFILDQPDSRVNNQTYNIGCGQVSDVDLIEIIKSINGEELELDFEFVENIKMRQFSFEKMTDELGFVPRYTATDAVRDLVIAFQKN